MHTLFTTHKSHSGIFTTCTTCIVVYYTLTFSFTFALPRPYREEAELEYMRVAQDLEMFGINYFEIKVHVCGKITMN